MDQYLLQILKDTNTIIIPDLGALTITNAEKNEVMFMPFLKHDDGKLSAHIAAKEGIDENEAKNIVAKHVREIKAKLDQGSTYDMFQFGTFSKGADGDIEFENWEAGDDKAAAPTPPPVVEKPKAEEKKPEPKKEEAKASDKGTESVHPKKAAEPKAEEKKEEPKKADSKADTKKAAADKKAAEKKALAEKKAAEKQAAADKKAAEAEAKKKAAEEKKKSCRR